MTSTTAPDDKRVLVVEDDADVRALLVRALSTRYAVSEAADGVAALEVLKKVGAVDLIICDVMMPKMNGYALSRLLKADAKMKTIPIIFLTARTSAKDVVAGINAGARHYIGKPFSVKDVLEKVGRILEMNFPLAPRVAAPLAVASGFLYFLAFAGLDVWPLTFVAFVPLVLALRGQLPKRALVYGLLAGTTMNVCGFYWLLNMLQTFSGFPTALCMLFVVIISTYQGGRLGLMGWLYARAEARGWPAAIVFAVAFVASELVYPLLFPWYYAATVHGQPVLTQVAELGGPILVGLVLVGVNLAIAEIVLSRVDPTRERKIDRRIVYTGAGGLAFAFVFGLVRVHMVDATVAAAPPVEVGVVQGNMGLMQKREDPGEGLRRHQRLSRELRAKGAALVVWSESAVTFPIQERMADWFMREKVARDLGVPAIFGAVLYRLDPDRERWFNVAISTDDRGRMTSRYDKEFLLAFGEYLPLGDMFPILYQWSPNSGKFSAGTQLDPLLVSEPDGTHKVTTLICYEDILPSFTNKAVRHADPELLVNITNDAWFGDTTEPWEHLALAQFRAIEHRRFLVRATNSGVSAIVDPVGRVVTHGGTFKVETLYGAVRWLRPTTVYEILGDIPWWIVSLAALFAAFRRSPWPRGGANQEKPVPGENAASA